MQPQAQAAPPASPQQFCLRWNNYQTNLTNVFDQLLQSESFVDVTLACEGHSVKAHKMVLSACSPYFQSLFFDNPCQHPIVILKDIKWPELKAVVEFMYRGEINVSQEQIGPLLKVAESLKIRGLADVNGETDLAKEDLSLSRQKKRRRTSVESSPEGSPAESLDGRAPLELVTTSPSLQQQQAPQQQQQQQAPQQQPTSLVQLPLQPPPPPPPQPQQQQAQLPPPPPPQQQPDDMEIKPGIAEMIREEERAKMLESSHAWLGASTSSLADSYQYQLQSMWQKCWNTNQSLVHNLRFRERGPLKSWRPETMAEAILSVLKEGLSLSQAARKYDIPYPTFVLYANRVHNMLGPSADGGTDLRPKGRGRPQRILLGIWPEEHIRGVIRAVVFRDPQHIKEEAINLGYPRIPTWLMMKTVSKPLAPTTRMLHNYEDTTHNQEHLSNYGGAGGPVMGSGGVAPVSGGAPLVEPCVGGGVAPTGGSGVGAGVAPTGGSGGVSPNSAAAAAVVAVAQGLRQQMLAAAAAAHHHVHHVHNHNHHHHQQQQQQQSQHPPQQQADFGGFLAAHCAAAAATGNGTAALMLHSPLPSPVDSSPRSSPLAPNNNLEVGGVGGYKGMMNDGLVPTRGDHHLFHDEIEDLVKRPQPNDTPKMKPVMGYKPMGNDVSSTRADHLFHDDMEPIMKRPHAPDTPKLKVGLGMSSLAYKPGSGGEGYGVIGGQRDALFQEEIEELVKSPQQQQLQQQHHQQQQLQQQQLQQQHQQQQLIKEPPQSPAPQSQPPPPSLHMPTVDQRSE